ncbi:MAG TPA: sugar nucleotide-binding protein [Chitinivibrionales bacterium]
MTPLPLASRKILLTGITSIHGWPIYTALRSIFGDNQLYCIRPPQVKTPRADNIEAACMSDVAAFCRIKKTFNPTHVLHMAGVCDLDMCEDEPEKAHAINTIGAKNIVDVFSANAYLLFLSADLVFSGYNPPRDGYAETDEPCPVSVVGKTFANAEKHVLRAPRAAIVRLGLPMGNSVQGEKGAIDFIEGRFKRGLPMTLFYDEWRSCIDCAELASIIGEMFMHETTGVYHCGGPRPVSLYEIGEWILKRGGYDANLLKRMSRLEEKNGPPRMGNVHLNSKKLERLLGRNISVWPG